jgi:hypothetical protein
MRKSILILLSPLFIILLFSCLVSVRAAVNSADQNNNQPAQSKIVTLSDNNKTVNLKTRERFLLKLGEGYDWEINVGNQDIVRRVPNFAVVRGAQGIYEAKKKGRTFMMAAGDPTCRKDINPCNQVSILFRAVIIVDGGGDPIKSITRSDNEAIINFKVGDKFNINLGGDLKWKIDSNDWRIIKRLPEGPLINDQGLYQAIAAGETQLNMTGAPQCEKDKACPLFRQMVKVKIVIK